MRERESERARESHISIFFFGPFFHISHLAQSSFSEIVDDEGFFFHAFHFLILFSVPSRNKDLAPLMESTSILLRSKTKASVHDVNSIPLCVHTKYDVPVDANRKKPVFYDCYLFTS